MSSVCEAYKIAINQENRHFVSNPYMPLRLTQPGKVVRVVPPRQITVHPAMTLGRVFDIKYGAQPAPVQNTHRMP